MDNRLETKLPLALNMDPVARKEVVTVETHQVMTQTQCDALADRIAGVLRERQEVGAERRRREREYQHRNSERALARSRRLAMHRPDNANGSPEFIQGSDHRKKEIDAYEALTSSKI